MPELPDGLSIGELARRTQVPAPTLRSWEDRYGFPRPGRLAGGHRRYDHGDVARIEAVVRLRASGMSLPAAISQAASRTAEAEASVFAGLRRRHPALTVQALRKVTLLALTRAIEDECCARAERPVLFASFQQQRFFRQSAERWAELARTARAVIVFADFGGPAGAGGPPPGESAPIRVPLRPDAPARREWTLVCDAQDYPACVTGWEFPGQREAADAGRRFEVIWSVDPQVVRTAAAICAQLAGSAWPGLRPLLDTLPSGPAPAASADLLRATGLLGRMTGYLEQAVGVQARPASLPGWAGPAAGARTPARSAKSRPGRPRFPHPAFLADGRALPWSAYHHAPIFGKMHRFISKLGLSLGGSDSRSSQGFAATWAPGVSHDAAGWLVRRTDGRKAVSQDVDAPRGLTGAGAEIHRPLDRAETNGHGNGHRTDDSQGAHGGRLGR